MPKTKRPPGDREPFLVHAFFRAIDESKVGPSAGLDSLIRAVVTLAQMNATPLDVVSRDLCLVWADQELMVQGATRRMAETSRAIVEKERQARVRRKKASRK